MLIYIPVPVFRAVRFLPSAFDAEAPSLGRLSGLEHRADSHASRDLPPPSLGPRKSLFQEGTPRICLENYHLESN
jgi:hypothetical protein